MITQKLKDLKKVLHHVCCIPHGINNEFKLLGPIIEGRPVDNSNICVSGRAYLDLTGGIVVGPWVMIGHYAQLFTHNHKVSGRTPLLLQEENNKEEFTIPVLKKICSDVWIYQSIVLPNCNHIAKGVIIGAGSVVTKPIMEEYSIWAGNPAKKIGER